jgi:hypothetical protein
MSKYYTDTCLLNKKKKKEEQEENGMMFSKYKKKKKSEKTPNFPPTDSLLGSGMGERCFHFLWRSFHPQLHMDAQRSGRNKE